MPRWLLSELGRQRMRRGLKQPWVRTLAAIYYSTEQNAIDGAAILAEHLALPFQQIAELGENNDGVHFQPWPNQDPEAVAAFVRREWAQRADFPSWGDGPWFTLPRRRRAEA